VPSSSTISQAFPPSYSLRSSDGGSFMFMTSTSTSPSLSTSPNAAPRLE
jgi:hypothetical protein